MCGPFQCVGFFNVCFFSMCGSFQCDFFLMCGSFLCVVYSMCEHFQCVFFNVCVFSMCVSLQCVMLSLSGLDLGLATKYGSEVKFIYYLFIKFILYSLLTPFYHATN